MRDESDSSDRKQVDYFLFALAFASFVVAGGGVIISSPLLALAGAMILVIALLGFLPLRPPGQ